MEELKSKDIINLIYQSEEVLLDSKIKEVNKKIKDKIKDINFNKLIKNDIEENDLKKIIEEIEENYSIKISEYNKEFYRQGFIDGVNLILNCLKK